MSGHYNLSVGVKTQDLIQSVSFTDDLILMRLSSFSSVGASGFHPIRHKHGL